MSKEIVIDCKMNGTVEWLPVIGYESIYEVSNHGQVRSLDRDVWNPAGPGPTGVYVKRKGKTLTPRIAEAYGYYQVVLCADGRRKGMAIHRLVALHFVSGDHSLQVNHIDGDKLNNRADNLEWVTCLDNVRHYHREIKNVQT